MDEEIGLKLAMEWGYKACEKGFNIQKAIIEFRKVMKGQVNS